jgi:hypothetical protein
MSGLTIIYGNELERKWLSGKIFTGFFLKKSLKMDGLLSQKNLFEDLRYSLIEGIEKSYWIIKITKIFQY